MERERRGPRCLLLSESMNKYEYITSKRVKYDIHTDLHNRENIDSQTG